MTMVTINTANLLFGCLLPIWLSIADCEILGVRVPLQPRLATVQAEGATSGMSEGLNIHHFPPIWWSIADCGFLGFQCLSLLD